VAFTGRVTRVTTPGYSREDGPTNGPLPDDGGWRNLVSVVNASRKGTWARASPLVLDANPARVGGVNNMTNLLHRLWSEDEGQDIAEYSVMLAVILVIVVGTIRLIGGNANNVFSAVSSSIGG
jgi:Flp pilus assembly pilin Flp